MIAQDLLTALQGLSSGVTARQTSDCTAFNCPINSLVTVLRSLRDQHGFDMLVDATAIDNGVDASPRFTVVYHLLSLRSRRYARVAADCVDDAKPSAPTVSHLWPTANWHERECFDMMGIDYLGHPDLRRILMWDSYPYHPLRKDFPLAGHPEDLWDEEISAETGTRLIAAPMVGGPFVAKHAPFEAQREPRAKDESWSEKKEKPDA